MSKSIEDVGEKIGGARKDLWWNNNRHLTYDTFADIPKDELGSVLTKNNIWPSPDYKAMKESGIEPEVAWLIKYFRKTLPTAPPPSFTTNTTNQELTQKAYLKIVCAVRDSLQNQTTVSGIRETLSELTDRIYVKNGPFIDVSGEYKAIDIIFHYRSPGSRRRTNWNGAEIFSSIRRPPFELAERKTTLTKWDKDESKWETEKTWDNILPSSRSTINRAPIPARRVLDHIERAGPSTPNNNPVTNDDLMDAFGFRGIEYGNWVTQTQRQEVLDHAYCAFMDLAEVLQIPPKALSLEGKLGIAFGSRGQGGRTCAHFEPDRFVINLTKLTGAGALAHEMGHAFDYHLSEQRSSPLTDLRVHSNAKLAAEVRAMMDTMTKTTLHIDKYLSQLRGKRSQAFDQVKIGVRNNLISRWARYVSAERREEERDRIYQEADQFITKLSQKELNLEDIHNLVDKFSLFLRANGGRDLLKDSREHLTYWADQQSRLKYRMTIAKRDLLKLPKTDTQFVLEARKLDKTRSKPYYTTNQELFARAFESYVFDKLVAAGRRSDYLVHSVEEKRFAFGYRGNPYPTGEERRQINRSIGSFLGQMRYYLDIGETEEKPLERWPEESPTQNIVAKEQKSFIHKPRPLFGMIS